MKSLPALLLAMALLAFVACREKPESKGASNGPVAEVVHRLNEVGLVPPVELSRVAPALPPDMVTRSMSGHFFVFEGIVDDTGKVRDLETLQAPVLSPADPALERAYKTALLKWTYKPATLAAKPVSVYMRWSFDPNPQPVTTPPPASIKPQWWIER